MALSLRGQPVNFAHGVNDTEYTLTEANGRRLDQRSVAMEVEVQDLTNPLDWTEDTTAEDNSHETTGGSGSLDATEGLVYIGIAPIAVRVSMLNVDVGEGGIVLEEEDLACVTLFKNSELVWYADEGFVTLEEATVEFNMDTDPIYLVTNDVLRLCVTLGLRVPGDGNAEDGIQVACGEEVGEMSITSVS